MRIGYLWLPHLAIQATLLRHPTLRGQPLVIGGEEGDGGQGTGDGRGRPSHPAPLPLGEGTKARSRRKSPASTTGARPSPLFQRGEGQGEGGTPPSPIPGPPSPVPPAPSSGRVVDASAECLAAGVRIGMAVREALEIVPGAVVLPPNPDADAELRGRALDLLERFSEVVEEDAAGAWFVPAGPLLPRDERRRGATIVDGLAAALGLEARVGLAPGKFLARVAAERVASGTVDVIAAGGGAAYLAPLPVALLPLSPGALDRLKLLGVTAIGEFARLLPDALPRRFGREALLAHRLARGDDPTLLVPRRRPAILTLRRAFEPPIEDRALLLDAATDLLARLCRQLQGAGQAFRSLGLSASLEDGRLAERRIDLREPTADPRRCQPLLRRLVEGLELERAVAGVALRLGAIGPEPPRQERLFDGGLDRAARRERVDGALAEIARRYRGRLRQIAPGDDPHSLLDDRRLLLLPYEPDGDPLRPPSEGEPANRGRPVRLAARGPRLYLVERDAARAATDEIVTLHARWEADAWWPDLARRTYYRVRTRRGQIVTLAHDHCERQWMLIERFD